MNAQWPLQKKLLSPSAWLLGAFCWFGKTRLTNPGPIFNSVDYDQTLAEISEFSIAEFQYQFSKISLDTIDFSESLLHTSTHLNWQAADLFLLYFCAELENDYWLNLALQELQGPQETAYPKIHLVCELLETLFLSPITPSHLATHSLINNEFIEIQGNGPLALCSLKLDREFWLAINHEDYALSYVNAFALKSDSTSKNLLSLPEQQSEDIVELQDNLAMAIRLKKVSRIRAHAELSQAINFAQGIALRLNLIPLAVNAPIHCGTKKLMLLCAVHRWMLFFYEAQETLFETLPKNLSVPAILLGRVSGKDSAVDQSHSDHSITDPSVVNIVMPRENAEQRKKIWEQWFSPEIAKTLADQWLISQSQINSLVSNAALSSIASEKNSSLNITQQKLYQARLAMAPNTLHDLAVLLPHQVNRDAIVFPATVEVELKRLLQRCKSRESIFDRLGYSANAVCNPGVRAVFSGESGTGKSLAAVYVASQLGMPIYRLDLGAILNKYVGETEKNIHRLMEQCAHQDFILLIDEADALFGKRSDGDSQGEKFSNMLTNYLLTRIENYSGIVLMTTNGLGRMDAAFLRRFDSLIQFAAPELEERARIWQTHLGHRSPGDEVCRQLASLCDLSGGFIRNAVLTAAAEVPASTELILEFGNLLKAIANEYKKSGKPLPAKLMTQLSALAVH